MSKSKKPQTPDSWKNFFLLALKLFLFGGIGLSLIFLVITRQELNWVEFLNSSCLNGLMWVFLWIGNGYFNDLVSARISWTKAPLLRMIVGILVMVGYTLISALGVFLFWFVLIKGHTFANVIRWVQTDFFLSVMIVTIIIGLFLHGRAFFFYWQESALEAERLKRENLSARYETLKNQVNPHFLFNSFNVLSTLVYKDQDLAAKFIKQLSNLYRYVLETKDKEAVTLATELEALRAFIFLSKIRFGDNLIVNLNIEDHHQDRVAPLALQMLVENAIKHNIVSKSKPLTIDIFREDKYLIVRNNLQKKNSLAESAGIGLNNIQSRYQYLTDDKVEIVEDNNFFSVKIPSFQLEE